MFITSIIVTVVVRCERERGAGGLYFFKYVHIYICLCTCAHVCIQMCVCERARDIYHCNYCHISCQVCVREGGGGGVFEDLYVCVHAYRYVYRCVSERERERCLSLQLLPRFLSGV